MNFGIALYLTWIVLWIVGAVGWVLNIITIVNSDFAQWTGILVARCLGVVCFPLGAVLGFC